MIERISPIENDEVLTGMQGNARRLVDLKRELLVLNGIHPDLIATSPHEMNIATQAQALTLDMAELTPGDDRFMGAWTRNDHGETRIAGFVETHSWHQRYLMPYAPHLAGKIALRLSMRLSGGQSEGGPLGVSSLIAETGDDQHEVLQELLRTVTRSSNFLGRQLYSEVPTIDPAHEVFLEEGFESTNLTADKHGITYTLFRRE